MPNGIDYGLIRDIGGARARGAQQAISQEQGVAALEDYMAKAGARTAIGGERGAAGYYEKEMRTDAYTKDVQSKMPFLTQMIAVGDRPGLEAMNKGFADTHGADLHTTELTNLIPGKFAELTTIKTGADIMQMDPNMQGIDPAESYQMQTRVGVDGTSQITDIKPAAAPKAPKAAPTVETGEGRLQWNPETSRYDIKVGPLKPTGKGDGAAGKWDKDALAALTKLYGTQTDMGIVVDPDRMAEYQDAMTYLGDYKAKGLTTSDAAVLSSRRSQAGGVDPITTVIQQQRGLGKSNADIVKLLRASKFKSLNPRTYGLTK